MISTFLLNQNFAFSTLSSGTASGATSFALTTGQGARFLATGNFMCVLWGQAYSTPAQDANREIIEVTGRVTDTLTATRAQESTVQKGWLTGDNIALVITAGKVTELETAINLRYGSGDSPSFAAITVSTLTASVPVVSDGSKNLVSVSYATFKSSLSLAKADISGLGIGDSPTFTGLNLSGLTASEPVVTDGSKNLVSVTYATFKSSLSLAQADISGLTTGSSPTFTGVLVSGLTASEPVVTDGSKNLASVSYATFKTSLSLTQADISGLTTGSSPTLTGLTLSGLAGSGTRYVTVTSGGTLGVGAGVYYTTTFTNASLVAGILTVTHNLTATYGVCVIVNNSGKVVVPDQIDFSAASTSYFTVDLTTFGTLTGTWVVIFLPVGGTGITLMSSPDYIGMEVFLDG